MEEFVEASAHKPSHSHLCRVSREISTKGSGKLLIPTRVDRTMSNPIRIKVDSAESTSKTDSVVSIPGSSLGRIPAAIFLGS
jgi:hypothetical protein